MTAAFLKLLNMSLTASLLILAVLPIRLLMKKAPKQITCLLWGIVAVALVCPVRFESPTSVLPAADLIIITTDTPQASEPLPIVQEEPILIQGISEQEPIPEQPSYVEIGSILWCMGMLALLGCAAFSWLRLKRRVAASIEIDKNVFVCDDIDTPFILGMIRPHIYLPSELDEITAAQVLTHERAHLARKDHWWKPLGYLLLTVHWFNPLVWVAYSLLCTDIELACDERVIKNMDTGSKQAYSEALLRCSMPRRLIAACPLAFGEVGVKQRIKAVLHYKKPAFWVILIAVVVCVALCAGFLTDPITEDLPEHEETFFSFFSYTSEDLRQITVRKDTDYEFVTANDIDRICGVLRTLEFAPVIAEDEPAPKAHQIILETKNRDTVTLHFNKDFTRISVTAVGYTSDIYEIRNPETLQHPDFPRGLYWAEDAMHSVIEGFLQANKLNIDNFELLSQMVEAYGIYAVVSFDLLNTDGSIRAADQLCLARLAAYNGEFYVIDVVSGQWSPANGFYPNYTEFDDQAVMWSSGSALGYDRFRMTYENGSSYYYTFHEGAFVNILYEGKPVELVPVDDSNNAAVHLTYGADYFSSASDSRFRINTQSGDILSITNYPVQQGSDIILPFAIYPDMDGSFIGYEALYDAIKTASSEELQKQKNIVLIGVNTLGDTEYAAIRCGDAAYLSVYLLECTHNQDGTVSISAIGNGAVAEHMGNYGYSMNYSMLSGRTLYWTTFADKRWATTADGTETDTTKTVPTDYTGFRFIWADLQEKEYPVEGSFFLAEVDSVIPPAIAIPMVGNNALTALGWRIP